MIASKTFRIGGISCIASAATELWYFTLANGERRTQLASASMATHIDAPNVKVLSIVALWLSISIGWRTQKAGGAA